MNAATQSQLLRFALVGVAGFVADAGVLYVAMRWLGAGYYAGRLLSFLVAVTVTWSLNRRYTFAASSDARLFREWARFLVTNAIGGLLNYAVYAVLVASVATVAEMPTLGVAAGSLAGLAINFMLSRKLVFTGSRPRR
jgi:putative flippase GtrA